MKIKGADELSKRLVRYSHIALQRLEPALKANAEDLARTAKVLIPKKTGKAAGLIKSSKVADGYQVDFGPLSRVLEGGRKKGESRKGRKYGAMPASPFVNPALKATEKRCKARIRRAANRAMKDAMREAAGYGG